MFVQRGAIEARESVGILRKVSWHPIEQHADACVVHVINEPT